MLEPGVRIEISASAVYAGPADPARWLSAAGSIFVSAIVAGWLFGAFTRRRPLVGLLAFVVAWVVSIMMIPVLPALLDVPFEAVPMCLDSCGHAIGSELTSGLKAFVLGGFVLAPAIAWPQFAILIAGVFVWTKALRPVPPPGSDRPGLTPS